MSAARSLVARCEVLWWWCREKLWDLQDEVLIWAASQWWLSGSRIRLRWMFRKHRIRLQFRFWGLEILAADPLVFGGIALVCWFVAVSAVWRLHG